MKQILTNQLLDYLEDIVFRTDPQMRFTYVNKAWERCTGYQFSDTVGRSLASFVHFPNTALQEISASAQQHPVSLVLQHAGGDLALYQLLLYKDDVYEGWSGIISQQTDFLKALPNTIRDGVLIINARDEVICYNRRAEQTLGYTQREILGKSLLQLVHDEVFSSTSELFHRLADVREGPFEVFAYSKNHDSIWLDGNSWIIRNEHLADIGRMVVLTDITEQKQASYELRRSEETKSAIINVIPDILFLLDKEGKYLEVYSTPENENQLALSREELLGRKIGEVLPSDLARTYLQSLRESIENNSMSTLEYQLQLQGTDYWFEARTIKSGEDKAIVIVRNVTEKMLAEQQLKKSEEKYRLLADNAMDIILLTSTSHQIYYVSPSLSKVLGFEPRNFLHVDFFQAIHPDDRPAVLEKYNQKKFPGYENMLELRALNKEGEYIWLESKSRIIEYDEERQEGMLLTVLRDITERKKNEFILKESEAKYRLLAEHVSDVIIMYDNDFQFQYVSPSVQNLLGYTPEEFIQLNIRDIITEDSLQQAVAAHVGRKSADEIIHMETEYITKDKKTIWCETTASTILNPEGAIYRYLATTRNIEDRKKAEQALKNSEQNLKEAQKIARMGSYEYDMLQQEIVWSDELYVILGIDPSASLSGDTLLNMIHPEDRETALQLFRRNAEQQTDTQGDFRIIRPDGEVIYILGINKLVPDESGKPVRAIGIIQDITERKLAEDRIEKQNRELRKLNQELDNLIYSSSHDLRSPLSSALGLLALIQMEKDPAASEYYLQLMEKSLRRLDNFTRDILDLYKNARSEPVIEAVDLQGLLRETLDEYQFLENSDRIQKIIQIKQPFPFYSESRRLKIIFSNLISNAIRYHNFAQENPYLEIIGEAGQDQAVIYIKDNGQGIAHQHIAKIFDMFYRANEQKKGSGLGLYLVKETIEKLKGAVQVDSVYGCGTTFTLTLANLQEK